MGIVQLNPDSVPLAETTLPVTITAPNNSIFTALVPETRVISLLKYVEGYPWTIEYYGQILNANNTLENFDPSIPNLAQPYYRIFDLILQVSSPLTSSYDQNTAITSISGTAITPYNLRPNVGDVFIAKVDNGEDAIFHITNVDRKTFRKDTLYEISYNLYAYTSSNPSFKVSLEQRVNDSYFFNKDTDFFNRDSLIKPSVKEAINRLKLFLDESQQYYLSTFPQKETGSILIPGMAHTLYDPLLLEFISKIVDYNRLVDVPFFRYTYFMRHSNQKSIYDAIINRSPALLKTMNKTYNFLASHLTSNRARFGTAFHAGVDYILSPTNPNTNIDVQSPSFFFSPQYINTVKTNRNYNNNTPILIETTNNNSIFQTRVLHELFDEDHYVVSKNFYDYIDNVSTYENISYIELLIYKFINKEAIAKEDLAVAVQEYPSWSLLHQLYLLPVMWLIVSTSVK